MSTNGEPSASAPREGRPRRSGSPAPPASTGGRSAWTGSGARREKRLALALVAGLATVLAIVLTQPIRDLDIFWHLGHGDWILGHAAIPRTDPFGFAVPNEPMCMNTWGADALFAAIHAATGLTGLFALRAACLVAAIALLAALGLRAGASPAIVAGWTTLAATHASFRFLVRPLVLEFLFTALWLWTIERYRRSGRIRTLAWQPLLAVLWSNSHGSYLLGPILSALAAAGPLLDRARARLGSRSTREAEGTDAGASVLDPEGHAGSSAAPWLPLAGACAVALAACLLNPCGREAIASPFRWRAHESATGFGTENLPLSFAFVWYGGFAPVLAILGGAFLLPNGRRKRSFDLALGAFLLAITLLHWRFLGLLLLATIPAASLYLTRLVRRAPPWAASFMGCVLVALALKDALPRASESRIGLKADYYPEEAADFLLASGIPGGRLFHNYDWGGYLLWRLAPGWKTFVDGRGHFFGPLLGYYDEMLRDEKTWREADLRFDFDAVLYPLRRDSVLYGYLERQGNWALVYWDDLAVVFFKRRPEWRGAVGRLEYRSIRPWAPDMAGGPDKWSAETLAEIDRNWRETRSGVAATLIATRAFARGEPEVAKEVLEEAASLHPGSAALWNNLAVAEERTGALEDALAHHDRALALDEAHAKSILGRARVLGRLGRRAEAKEAYRTLLGIDPSSRIAREGLDSLEKDGGGR